MTTCLQVAQYMKADLNRNDRDLADWLKEQYGRPHVGHSGTIDFTCSLRGVTLDYLDNDDAKEMTWLQFVKTAKEENAMGGANVADQQKALKMLDNMMDVKKAQQVLTDEVKAARLLMIEERIGEHMAGMYRSALGIGRCLVEAKDAALVPHGEWEGWLKRVAGMTPRTAQRLMQAARETPKGSVMEQLPISKIQALLALPEGEREGMAQRTVEEDLNLQQLQDAIALEHKRSEQMRDKYNSAIKDLKVQRESTERLGQQVRMKDERNAAQQAELDDLRRKYDVAHEASQAKNAEIIRLRGELDAAKQETAKGISPEAEARIRALEEDLKAAEEYAEQQAALRQEAQQQLLNAQMGAGRSEPAVRRFGPGDLKAAVNGFLGEAGVLVHMGVDLARMNDMQRQEIKLQIKRIQQWADGAAKALRANVLVD